MKMKKKILAICLSFMLMFSVGVAFACEEPDCAHVKIDIEKVQGAIGEGNVGIQTNGAVKDNTINTGDTINTVNKTGIFDSNIDVNRSGLLSGNNVEDSIIAAGDIKNNDTQFGIQNGNKNTAINGDMTGDIDNSDNSILKNANLKDSQNGLLNQKGFGNQQGLVNQKGMGNQQGLVNQKGVGNQMGLVNLKGGSQMGLVNVKGSGNQAGIQLGVNNNAVNGDNNGVIVQQTNAGGGNNYPGGIMTDETISPNGPNGGQGGGGGGNNIVNAMVDNSVYVHEETRELLPSPELMAGPLGDYKGDYVAGGAFQPVEKLILLKKDFSFKGTLETYTKPYSFKMCEARGLSYNGRHEDDPTLNITVYKDKYPKNVKSIGFLTAFATKKGKGRITSFMVLQRLIWNAAVAKGNAILITGQGFETVSKTKGWGLGWNTSGSILNEMGNRARGGAMSGGTGYSSGGGEIWTLPYITCQVLQYTAE